MTEEMKKHFALLSEQYPRVRPCINCYYWTGANNMGGVNSVPHCNFLNEEGFLRDCLPDLENHTCERFVPKKQKRKKLKY